MTNKKKATTTMIGKDILELAEERYVEGLENYGVVSTTFTRIAEMARATGRVGLKDILESDIAVLMILLKIARETQKHKKDNCTDIAGYANILNILEEGEG